MACGATSEWEIKGKGSGQKIDEMWFQKIVTKVLINLRFRLGRLIDTGAPKPPEVSTECWSDLVKWRASEVSKKKSAQMRSISRRRASKSAQMQGLREAALVRLVRQLFSPVLDFPCFAVKTMFVSTWADVDVDSIDVPHNLVLLKRSCNVKRVITCLLQPGWC
jgi:hypothetical protein